MVNNEMGNNNRVMGLFMDLQKAFDTFNFDILLYKLNHYRIRGQLLPWLKHFYIIGLLAL